MPFKPATKEEARLRLGLHGPSGSGKTFSALSIAEGLLNSPEEKIAVIDSERGASAKYSDRFKFDIATLEGNHHPENYIKLIDEAGKAGYKVIIIDSATQAWNGRGGFLELVEIHKKRSHGNGFSAWNDLTPIYQRLVETILASPAHVIVTLRAKTEYVMEKTDTGKTTIRKQGLAPEFRDNFQYEMDIEGMMNLDHELIVGKTRCPGVDGRVFQKPGKEFVDIVKPWLTGAPTAARVEIPSAPNEVLDSLREDIRKATDKDNLTKVSVSAQAAYKDGKITMEEYKSLTPEYKAKLESLNG